MYLDSQGHIVLRTVAITLMIVTPAGSSLLLVLLVVYSGAMEHGLSSFGGCRSTEWHGYVAHLPECRWLQYTFFRLIVFFGLIHHGGCWSNYGYQSETCHHSSRNWCVIHPFVASIIL